MENKDENFEIKDKPLCMIVLGMAGSGKVMDFKQITVHQAKFSFPRQLLLKNWRNTDEKSSILIS